MKRVLILALFLLCGLLAGTVLTSVAGQVSFLHWLCWGDAIGFGWPNPVTLDLSVLKLSFGISLEMNVAKMICIIAALACYLTWGKKL